ncbi:hypothetical protein PF010_g5835 [Phytophthora fragariae]|uniref:EF-hand domain-containing protein n=1 Tax=Phytophthora fragariae TaxID=53985 RepID=A0A6A3LKP1_9STRA|nr:hypothetical protein PF011_g6122 [Phytophthora fragariae]KAE9124897.1 hypothetical protein PF010_g5835 [Phytophthora fragariae]
MAAALLQYQACLGIMVRLQVEDLTLLKDDFDRAGRGLSLREFVNVMLDRVSWEPESVVNFIEDLVELFAQVDVNGDGTMEWEEFTSAIIEGGMGSSGSGNDDVAGTVAQLRDLQYEEHPHFVDTAVNRPPKRIEYLPEFRRVLLLESSRPVVELLDPAGLFPPENEENVKDGSGAGSGEKDASGESNTEEAIGSTFSFTPTLPVVNKFHPLCYISGYRRDQDEVRSERSPVQALKYLAGLDLLAVSAGDLKLTFWSSTLLTACSTSAMETPRPLAIVHTPRPQRVLEWSSKTQQLFSISADLMISVWQVTRSQTISVKAGNAKSRGESSDGTCEVRLVTTLKKHSDLLQDLLILNEDTLLSCGMDNMIYLWDTHTLQTRASRQGHRRGVRLMVKLSSQVFISAGFECEVFGWEISALATTPVFRLSGHGSPVCCIQLIPSATYAAASALMKNSKAVASGTRMLADQCITVDDEGWFRWWTLANVLSVESTDAELNSSRRCLQVFRLGSDLSRYPWRAHSLAVLNNGQSLLVAGVHKVKLLRRVRVKPRVLAASAVLYNEASLTIATATDREVRVWDAASGAMLRTYRDLVGADITQVDLDSRQRKLIVGAQNGELAVVNYLNGAVLARWTPHAQQVSALLYCKEDHTVLTASWDRSLRLYDDDAPRGGGIAARNVLLRCITDAHDSDIKCLAYCHALSLVASGGIDGSIKLWDYIYFLLEDTLAAPPPANGVSFNTSSPSHGAMNPHATSEVNVLEFIEPYPLLLSGHESGQVCLWSLTLSKPTTLLMCFYPFHMTPVRPVTPVEIALSSDDGLESGVERSSFVLFDPDTQQNDAESSAVHADTVSADVPPPPSSPLTFAKLNSAVTCCRTFYDETGGEQLAEGIDRGRFLLFVASFYGELMVCDISKVITAAHVRAFREENMPSRQDRSYNPRRRFLRQGKNAKRLRNKHADNGSHPESKQLHVNESDVTCTHRWTAHRGNVRCLQIVAEPRGVLTCGSDKGVHIWDFQGRRVGSLATGMTPTAAPQQPVAGQNSADATMANGFDSGSVWRWEVDVASAAAFKRKQAEQLWEELKGSKLKTAALKQQSVTMAKRVTMVASASAPALGQDIKEIQRRSVREMTSSASMTVIELNRVEEVVQDEEQPEETDAATDHTTRLFDQLQGKTTWKKSDLQLARQAAWEKERVKFQQRMKKVVRQKAKKKTQDDPNAGGNQHEENPTKHQPNGDVNDSLGKLEVLGGAGDAGDPGMLLPTLQNPVQELPFADKDNWAVGSLNREQQMYEHFHRENVRRNNKQVAGSSGLLRQRRLESSLATMDLTPSAFLLEKLGVSCIIRENVELKDLPGRRKLAKKPPRPKRVAALTRAHSLTALPSPPTADLNQAASTLTSSVSTSVLPKRSILSTLCQQYDELLGTDRDDDNNSSPQPPSNTYLSASQSSGADSPAILGDESLTPVDTASSSTDDLHSMCPASTESSKQDSPKPARRRHPRSAITTKERGPKLRQDTPSSSSAGAVRTVPRASIPKKELKSAKKVRIRSDAALMRQERFGPYSRDDVINVYRTFRKLDQDQSGAITLRELLDGSGLFSGTHMQDNIGSIFSSIDKDHSGLIDLAELCGVVFGEAPPEVLENILRLCRLLETVEKTRRVQRKTLTAQQVQELRELFKLYDADDNGNVDAGELLEALRYNERFYDSDRRGSTQLTKEDVIRIISAFDVNANASLDLEEFIELFREDA